MRKAIITTSGKTEYVELTTEEEQERLAEEQAWFDAAPERARQDRIMDLGLTDSGMARISEDVIDLLVRKGVFSLEELPLAAQEKLAERQALREKIVG